MPDDIIYGSFDESVDDVIDSSGDSELTDEQIAEAGSEEFGPYESHLYTNGNEFWLEDVVDKNQAQFLQEAALNEANSYTGWYHVRNANTVYQLLIPTKTKEDDYDGPPLLQKRQWFLKRGLTTAANHPTIIGTAPTVKGCTNSEAWNYNPLATEDDGTCWIIPGYFLGQVPPQAMFNLHTTGGELTHSETFNQYRGYYHVYGSGDLPLKSDGTHVPAGSIWTGKEWNGNNIQLWPVTVEGRFLQERQGIDVTEQEDAEDSISWYKAVSSDGNGEYESLEMEFNSSNFENNTLMITVDTTAAGENKDFFAFDNTITYYDSISIMENMDYQFNHLLSHDETKTPGIYGMKPKLVSDINVIEFAEEGGGAYDIDTVDTTVLPEDVIESNRINQQGNGNDPGGAPV